MVSPKKDVAVREDILAGGGEMGALMRSHDWSKTSLGPVQRWPQSLKTAVRIMLTSRQAMFVWWGEELISLYNDAYKAIVGGKHPGALGQPASYVWREIWDQVGPRAESAMLNNEGTYDEALMLIMERNGYSEETYYTFSYSPVPNDEGGTGGIICANTDDTQRIIGERQLTLLRELATKTADARTFDAACTLSANCLETNPYDLPFAMIYLVDPDQRRVFLAGTCGIGRGHAAAPETVALDEDSVWPFAQALETHQTCLVSDLAAHFSNLPTGAWEQSPHQAMAVPIVPSGQTGKAGLLVAGLNLFRLFDDHYRGFIDQVAAQISASIANAQAYEEEQEAGEALLSFSSSVSSAPSAYILPADDDADMRDYVKRLLSQQELQRTTQTLRAVIEASPLPIVVIELDTTVRLWNPAAVRLFNWSEAEVLGQPIPIVPQDKLEEFLLMREAVVNGETFFGVETYRCKLDGAGVGVSISAAPLYDESGTLKEIMLIFQDITERQQAEQALRESEARFRHMADTSPVMMWMSGTDNLCDYFSQSWLNFTGRTLEQEMGKGWAEGVHPDDFQRCLDTYVNAFDARQAFQMEYRLRRFDGQYCWIFDVGVPRFTPEGSFLGYIGSCIDIDNRKRNEETIRSLLRISERLNSTLDVNALLDILVQEAITLVNAESGCSGLYTAEGMVCHKYFQNGEPLPLAYCWPPEHGIPGWLIVHKVPYLTNDALTDTQIVQELRVQFGVRCALSTPILNSQGEILGFFEIHNQKDGSGFAHSDQEKLVAVSQVAAIAIQNALAYQNIQQTENALRQSESRFQTLVKNMPGMVYRYHPGDDAFTYVSSGSWDLFELEPEIIRQDANSLWALIHPDDLQTLKDSVARAVQHSLPWEWEGRIITLSGQLKWIQGTSRPEGTTDGKVWDGLLIDISDRKLAEAEREQLLVREQAARTVSEAARSAAERANRIKDEFLAVLSHELRSPLNPILGWARLLQGRQLDEQATQRALETIERNAKLQTRLIEDLLDVSRILRGKMVLNVSPVNLVTASQAAIETVQSAAEAKHIEIQTMFASDLGLVSGDSTRLQQIVWNLLSNAVKFTPERGRVEVRLERVGTHAQIQVKDTGKGITREFLPHVFEYFRQEDGTTTRQFGGLGIGLAIVRHLSELHGGTVHAESLGEGLGATFTVRIPLMATASKLPQDTNSDTSALDLGGLRVLVVDDEADTRELVRFILEQWGAQVKAVASAQEALTVLDQFNPDVLISDIGMPTMDGYTLMRQVRNRLPEQGGRVSAIALSAYAGELDHKQALDAGFQRHISKPVEPEELVQAIIAIRNSEFRIRS